MGPRRGCAWNVYIIFSENSAKGPIANALGIENLEMKTLFNLNDGDALFFLVHQRVKQQFSRKARVKIAIDRELIEKNIFKFCWIVDYPMFEKDENTGKIEFSHNPFSMPQGGMKYC